VRSLSEENKHKLIELWIRRGVYEKETNKKPPSYKSNYTPVVASGNEVRFTRSRIIVDLDLLFMSLHDKVGVCGCR